MKKGIPKHCKKPVTGLVKLFIQTVKEDIQNANN